MEAEHRGVDADTQCQRQNSNGSKDGTSVKHPQGVTNFLEKHGRIYGSA
jgi:hypothetical protein